MSSESFGPMIRANVNQAVYHITSVVLPQGFPEVVTLCGSTRFREAFEQAMKEETLKGNIVLSVGTFGHLDGLDMDGDVKKRLDQLHFRKIEMSDSILVLNVRCHCHNECGRPVRMLTHEWFRCDDCKRTVGPGEVARKLYVGESTRNEINHAARLGVKVRYLNPVE